MGAIRKSLPASSAADEILELIRTNRVVIIAGETGCGKTTQVPQFILDEAIEAGTGSECNIVVTQPRRVSAIGVASRVAVERGEELDGKKKPVAAGSLVGYAIRGERRASRECRLLFTTTGVLLRRLGAGGDKDLKGISHVVVDEVHERNVDSDFLLLELRELLKRNNKIKVVLMSATINQETFASYFGRAPCISIRDALSRSRITTSRILYGTVASGRRVMSSVVVQLEEASRLKRRWLSYERICNSKTWTRIDANDREHFSFGWKD